MITQALYYFFKTKAYLSTFFNENVVSPFNNVISSVYNGRIVRVDEYDLGWISRKNIFKSFFLVDLMRHIFIGDTCGLETFSVPKDSSNNKIFKVTYWDGSSVLLRGSGTSVPVHELEVIHHFRNNAYLYAGLHKGKDGKIDVTDFFNKYARCLCFNVKEVLRLLFVMDVIAIEDYHRILEGSSTSITLISCRDDLVITTLCDNDSFDTNT